ncbi:MAG: hypothetical protein ACPG7B_12140, partial [Pseudomonadales bacterium]
MPKFRSTTFGSALVVRAALLIEACCAWPSAAKDGPSESQARNISRLQRQSFSRNWCGGSTQP